MMETSKLETINAAEKTMAAIHSCLNKARTQETMDPVAQIDTGAFDEYILPHGPWPDSTDNHPTERRAREV